MPRSYETASGHVIEHDPDPRTARFLARVQELVADPRTKENDIIGFAYGSENPMLLHVPGGRSIVTRETLEHPSYLVLGDLLYRKRIQQTGMSAEEVAARYTATVADAAAVLGVTPDAVRKRAREHKLPSWVKGGEYFFDPKSLATFARGAERGPAAAGGALRCVAGGGWKSFLRVKAPGRAADPIGGSGAEEVTIRKWRRIAVQTGSERALRFYELEHDPAARASPETISFGKWHVDGPFRVVRKINNAREARHAWEAFRPA